MSSINNQQPHRQDSNRPRFAFLRRIESHIQGKTLSGLMQLVPLLVTVFIIAFIIGKVDGIIHDLPFIEDLPGLSTGARFVGGLIDLILIIILLYLGGLVLSTWPGRKVMQLISGAVSRVPVVRTVYGVTQQATIAVSSDFSFTRPVFLEWPREGMAAVGFVTARVHSESTGMSMAVVYIPTVPNPTSGNLAFVVEDDLIETDLTVDAAMQLVFSGGIVLPDSVVFARLPREREERELIGRFVKNPD